jgi:hypothetical protein
MSSGVGQTNIGEAGGSFQLPEDQTNSKNTQNVGGTIVHAKQGRANSVQNQPIGKTDAAGRESLSRLAKALMSAKEWVSTRVVKLKNWTNTKFEEMIMGGWFEKLIRKFAGTSGVDPFSEKNKVEEEEEESAFDGDESEDVGHLGAVTQEQIEYMRKARERHQINRESP